MHVVALPGRRSETEPWLRDLLLAAGLPDSGVVRYRHWNCDIDASVFFEAALLSAPAHQLAVAAHCGGRPWPSTGIFSQRGDAVHSASRRPGRLSSRAARNTSANSRTN